MQVNYLIIPKLFILIKGINSLAFFNLGGLGDVEGGGDVGDGSSSVNKELTK